MMLAHDRLDDFAAAETAAPSFGFGDVIRSLRTHKFLVGSVTLAGVAGAAILSHLILPTYVAEAVLLAEPSSPLNVTDLRSNAVMQVPDPAATRTIVETIGSPAIVARSVSKLPPAYREVLDRAAREQEPPRQSFCQRVVAAVSVEMPAIVPEVLGQSLPEYFRNGVAIACGFLVPADDTAQTADRGTARRLQVTDFVSNHLQVDNDGRSYIVRVRYSSSVPEVAASVANGVAKEYLAFRSEQNNATGREVVSGLATKLSAMKDELARSERGAQQLREQVRLQELRRGGMSEQQTAGLLTQLNDARLRLTQAEARLGVAKSASSGASSSEVLSSRLIQDLRVQQAERQRQTAQLTENLGPSHPAVKKAERALTQVNAAIGAETARIVRSLQSDVAASSAQVQALTEALRAQERAIGPSSEAYAMLRQAERQTQSLATVYEQLLLRERELTQREDLPDSQVRLLSEAGVPLRATGLGSRILVALGGIGGFLVGTSGAVLATRRKDKKDPLLLSRQALDNSLSVSFVPRVPNLRKGASVYVALNPSSPYAESMHWVRASLRGQQVPGRRGVIAVTSALPGAGKSAFCAGLATAMTLAGETALVVDCDLRKEPSLDAWGGGDAAFEQVKVPGYEDLGVWLYSGSGSLPDMVQFHLHPGHLHPHAILSSGRLGDLIKEFAARYDYIILDNSPLSVAADSLFVGENADECIMIANWRDSSAELVRGAVSDMRARGIRVRRLVVNCAELPNRDRGAYRTYAESNSLAGATRPHIPAPDTRPEQPGNAA